MTRFVIPLWILGVVGWLWVVPAAVLAEDERLQKILADWQKRQNAMESIEYQVEGELKVPKGAYTRLRAAIIQQKKSERLVAPEQDLRAPIGFNLLLDFAKERYRLETKQQSFNFNSCKLEEQRKTYAFDGRELKCFLHREKNPTMRTAEPDMAIVTGNLKNEQFLLMCYPIFFSLGRIHTPIEQIVPGKIRNKPDPNYLYIHGEGVHEDRSCLILRTQALQLGTIAFEEYWVDPSRDSAIVRYVTYSGKKPKPDGEIVIRYGHSSEGSILSAWRWTGFDNGKMLYYHDFHVVKMKTNPIISDADFDVAIRTGMIVEEVKNHPTENPFASPKSDVTVYRVEQNGKRTYVRDPYHRAGDQYEKNRPRHRFFSWFLPTMALIIGFLVWARYRLKKKAGQMPNDQP